MRESKLGSAPDGAGAVARAVESDASGGVAAPEGVAGAGGGAGGAAGRPGIVGAVTRSVAEPLNAGVKVAPSFAHTSSPAGYCVRHRGQTDTPPV